MNFRKAISAVAALAISVSCFAGLAVTSHAEDGVVNLSTVASAYWNCGNKSSITEQTFGVNGDYIVSNGDTSDPTAVNWYGFGIMEFTLPAMDSSRIKSATLTLHTKNERSGNRSVELTTVNNTVTIAALTTDDEKTAFRSAIVSAVHGADTLATFNASGIQSTSVEQTVSGEALVNYIKSVANSENSTKLQFGQAKDAGNNFKFIMTTDEKPTLSITLADASAQAVKYTVKYVDAEGNELKDSVERDGFVGTEVSATADDKKDFVSADGTKKYVYTAGGTETITPTATAAENIITVKFTEVSKVAYSVTDPTTNTEIATGSDFVGNTVTVAYPRYIRKGDKLYMHDKQSGNPNYGYAFALDADAAKNAKELTYTEVADKGTVVYFAEGEDIEGFTKDTGGNANIRCSMNAAGNMTSGATVTVTTLPAGKYRLYAGVWGNTGGEFTIKAGETGFHFTNENPAVDGDTIKSAGWWLEYGADQDLTITEDTAVTVTKNDAANGRIDYIYIMKTGDVAVDVQTPTEVASAPALTSPTGKLGTEPTFDTISAELTASKMLKFDVVNPLENVYPKVTVKGTEYQLDANTITAIANDDGSVSYYMSFKAKTEDDLKDFGTITFAYGSGENTDSATYDFNPVTP